MEYNAISQLINEHKEVENAAQHGISLFDFSRFFRELFGAALQLNFWLS